MKPIEQHWTGMVRQKTKGGIVANERSMVWQQRTVKERNRADGRRKAAIERKGNDRRGIVSSAEAAMVRMGPQQKRSQRRESQRLGSIGGQWSRTK